MHPHQSTSINPYPRTLCTSFTSLASHDDRCVAKGLIHHSVHSDHDWNRMLQNGWWQMLSLHLVQAAKVLFWYPKGSQERHPSHPDNEAIAVGVKQSEDLVNLFLWICCETLTNWLLIANDKLQMWYIYICIYIYVLIYIYILIYVLYDVPWRAYLPIFSCSSMRLPFFRSLSRHKQDRNIQCQMQWYSGKEIWTTQAYTWFKMIQAHKKLFRLSLLGVFLFFSFLSRPGQLQDAGIPRINGLRCPCLQRFNVLSGNLHPSHSIFPFCLGTSQVVGVSVDPQITCHFEYY